ncbi:type II secretion system protein GspK [Brytella acorum]|uniref:Type II secretion system protein GspK n=1 Tax=Brytella acorum TaxID=2959299 RepID=A0AA35Y2T4_9PROT|nr:type II secretion system protein GspK [Brytella acorum]MDF3624853.1 type II secretion system protein GspK [Brytella acorum]CAI9120156.1 type II secretion system protein GspK [Brytella acorum]
MDPSEHLRKDHDEGGFALLAVLLALGLLSLVVTQIAAAGRQEVRLAFARQQRAMLEAAADGGVQLALFHILQTGNGHWRDDGSWRPVPFDTDVRLAVSVTRMEGQVNPSGASQSLLVAMIRQCGMDATSAGNIASAIVAWRTPGAAVDALPAYRATGRSYGPRGTSFVSMADFSQVLGMTPTLAACLAPHLSFTQLADPSPTTTDAFVRAALRASADQEPKKDAVASGEALQGSGILRPVERRIDVVASSGAFRFHRIAIVDVTGRGESSSYVIRRWFSVVDGAGSENAIP